ncbi:MAG: hypothetical protein NC548_24460 [Lachnospiraceae bacterium]|nr:hypothetical protein [Lachnospiraceae bacterium]
MKLQNDKIQHFAVCFLLAAIVSVIVAFMSKNTGAAIFAGASSAMALGVGKEYGDEKASENFWDWKDISADALGAVLGACFGLFAIIM